MKKLYVLIGYAGAALVLAISIDVAARVGAPPSVDDEKKAEVIARDVIEHLDEVTVVKASAASCEKLLVLQKDMAVEMAVALSGKKQKKARRKIKKEIEASMTAKHDEMLAACTEIPQAEVDCVLGTDDPAAWADCGPHINSLK